MTHLRASSILLGILIFTVGCATTPEVGDSQVPDRRNGGEISESPAPPSDDPIAYFPAPREEPLTVSLPSPNPFRFDAIKKAALQKEKRRLGVRRAPVGSLSPIAARSRLSPPLSGDNLPNPSPPPATPQVEPILPAAEIEPPTIDGATPIEWRIESEARAGEAPGQRLGSVTGTDSAAQATWTAESAGEERKPRLSTIFEGETDSFPGIEGAGDSGRHADTPQQADPATGMRAAEGGRQSGAAARPTPGSADGEPQPGTAREASGPVASAAPEGGSSDTDREPTSASRSIAERSRYPYEFLDTASETTAPVGEEMGVSLPGEGWLFLGESSHQDAVRFISQNESEAETFFRFRISRPGVYELLFQRQDLMAGTLAEHLLSVEAKSSEDGGSDTPDEGLTRITAAELGLAAGGPSISGDSASQERTSSSEDGAAISDTGDSLTAPEQIRVPRWPEEIDTAELLSDLNATLTRADESPEESVLSLSELLVQRRNPEGALLLLEEYQRRGETEVGLDEVWFEMAQLLERREEVRDLRRAVALYEQLVDEYPLSVYYRDARQRAEYLQRHFFLVR